jgi:drug/metabolite transporter (DMT)-like permease
MADRRVAGNGRTLATLGQGTKTFDCGAGPGRLLSPRTIVPRAPMPPPPLVSGSGPRGYLLGCFVIVLAGVVLTLGIFCVRGATESDAWQYIFWRALGFLGAMTVVAWVRDRRSPIDQVTSLGRMAIVAALAMAASQITFISALKVTTVAETMFLCSLAPLIAAALARPVLGEHIGAMALVAIALGLVGVALMTGGDLSGGNWLGRTLSVASAFAFAAYSLFMRGAEARDLDAALILVGVITAAAGLAATLASGLPLFPGVHDVLLALVHGAVLLSIGLFLYGQGSRTVSAVTFTMLAQTEAIVAPFWGYLYFAEQVTLGTIAGGALILTAVVLQAASASSARQV